MSNPKALLLPALALPLAAAAWLPADTLEFAPEEGKQVTKTFVQTLRLDLDDQSILMNGEENPMGDMEMEMSTIATTVVADTYAAVGDGRPKKIVRTFEELESEGNVSMEHAQMGSQDQDITGSSELEGATVVFTWDPDLEEYSLSYQDEDAPDDELLEGLDEDMDLRLLLPGRAVSAGDTWRIDLSELASLFAPGGNMQVVPEDMDMPMGGGDMMWDPAEMLGELEGTATATYQGSRDVGGTTVGSVALVFDVSSAKDMTEMLIELMAEMESPNGMDMEMDVESADVEFEFEGGGELLWDLRNKHFHSLRVEGDTAMVMDMVMTMNVMGEDMDLEQTTEMSGTILLEASVASE